MISFQTSGDYSKTGNWLKRLSTLDFRSILTRYGNEGVSALAAATPTETGLTASSWDYIISGSPRTGFEIVWTNSNVNDGVQIAVILQMGHGTRNGGYVRGRDYINPAMRPIFDKIAQEAWKAVKHA